MSEKIIIDYEIMCHENENIEVLSKAIALEQTVEVPETVLKDKYILEQVVGQINSIEPIAQQGNCYKVKIAYQNDVTGYEIPQFLNILFGNISIKNNIKITGVTFNDGFLNHFKGPRYGVEGIRQITGVFNRPLAATALKPMGQSPRLLAEMALMFALGGGDIIKDDHGLADQTFCTFNDRVQLVQEAIDKANDQTGNHTLYFPNIIGSHEKIMEQLDFANKLGVKGILISPLIIGPDTVRYIADHYSFIIMTHPAFSGTHFHNLNHGIEPAVLLGTINRLIGADIAVFPNSGGRFGFTPSDCRAIETALQEPMGEFRISWPAPAGGMSFNNIEAMSNQYGMDTVYLIGGALLDQKDGIEKATRKMMSLINEWFKENRQPVEIMHSACELPLQSNQDILQSCLTFNKDGFWNNRQLVDYKPEQTLPFKGIARSELIGNYGEHTKFDLRYFRIKAGGYSSMEKHVHEHVIIGVHGKGHLKMDDEIITLNPNDIVYIQPMQVHQLVNNEKEDFGFYCIVDHQRDRPQKP